MKVQSYGRKNAQADLPRRRKSANKSDSGKSLIIAGSAGMWGAAILTATAAARVGSGYVTLLTQVKKFPVTRHPDFLSRDITKAKIADLNFNAAAIGPGLGISAQAKRSLKALLKIKNSQVVLDADGLNLCAKEKIFPLPHNWVMTPHEGELARLLNVSVERIRAQREDFVRRAQEKFKCVVLLKGRHTLVASSDAIHVIKSGNAALAKAGTGDVLTGMICGFIAQGLAPYSAACLAAYVHGSMADNWLRSKKDVLSLLATDLLEMLPHTLFELRNPSPR